MLSILLRRDDVIVGVDTHQSEHVAVLLDGLGGPEPDHARPAGDATPRPPRPPCRRWPLRLDAASCARRSASLLTAGKPPGGLDRLLLALSLFKCAAAGRTKEAGQAPRRVAVRWACRSPQNDIVTRLRDSEEMLLFACST